MAHNIHTRLLASNPATAVLIDGEVGTPERAKTTWHARSFGDHFLRHACLCLPPLQAVDPNNEHEEGGIVRLGDTVLLVDDRGYVWNHNVSRRFLYPPILLASPLPSGQEKVMV